MISYNDFTKDKQEFRLDRKNGFYMFLKLIDDLKMNFFKTGHYLNTGHYQYFFTTEHIRNKENFLGYFRESLSLKVTCDTAIDLKDNRISFYFGIKDNNLEYGFQDDMKGDIYKTGTFKVDTRYVRSLKSYKCLVLISSILNNANLSNLNLLHDVKTCLKVWYQGKGSVSILNDSIIKKSIDKDDIKDDLSNVNNLLRKYEKWCEKFSWVNKVFYYIDSDDEDKVTFYVKIKPKKNVEE